MDKCEALVLEYKEVDLNGSTALLIKEIEDRLKELLTDHPKRIRLIIENTPDETQHVENIGKIKKLKKHKYINNTRQVSLSDL